MEASRFIDTKEPLPSSPGSLGRSKQLGLKASINARGRAGSRKARKTSKGTVIDDDSFDFYLSNEFADETDSCPCAVCQRARDGLNPINRQYFTLEIVEW
eukprot:CAMPEP_0184502536 /NCGR_PEP_ID=MMETSP0113_2-20130426/50631_1 /TAXON_ID=91329 /ORGANISM="Norrisiella sphaerica, Strain BC52" /LENGTH=99 /DNA_ID=CAMNT_0026891771 /DNA_START=52 /DNA_END=348 /DNA_ORIENTATION=+